MFYYFSVSDIVSDFNLFVAYMEEVTNVLKTVTLQNDSTVLNTTGRTCTLLAEHEDGYTFSCEEYNHWFASLTLLFIYLPSLNVIATLYGPSTTGPVGGGWGIVMFIVGGACINSEWSVTAIVMRKFLIVVGMAFMFFGGVMVCSVR